MTQPQKHKIPDEALPVVRDALRMQILSVLQELSGCASSGGVFEWEPLDAARALLRELDDSSEVAECDALLEALRRQLDTERDLSDTHDPKQREHCTTGAAMIGAVLAAIQA
jgi:hypothetical protein